MHDSGHCHFHIFLIAFYLPFSCNCSHSTLVKSEGGGNLRRLIADLRKYRLVDKHMRQPGLMKLNIINIKSVDLSLHADLSFHASHDILFRHQ
jgi:hypothetical protein